MIRLKNIGGWPLAVMDLSHFEESALCHHSRAVMERYSTTKMSLDPTHRGHVSAPEKTGAVTGYDASHLLGEQVRLLYSQAPVAIVTALVVAVIVTAAIWKQTAPLPLGIWIASLTAISLARLLLVKFYNQQKPGGSQISRWLTWYTTGTFFAGMAWGAAAFLVDFSWPVEYQLLMYMSLAGIAAGAISSNATIFSVYAVFVIPTTLPMGILLLKQADTAYATMGSLIILFCAALMIIARRYNRNVADTLLLGQEKQVLLNQLSVTNRNLRNEVVKYERAEAARNESQAMATALGQILDDSLNEIYVFDAATLRFVKVNKGARHNLGYSMAELKNLTALDLKPDMTPGDFEALLAPLHSGEKKIIQFETRHRRKDGSCYPVVVYLQSAVLASASVFVAIILDVTERKIAEDKLQQAATVFANISDAVIISDPDARITAVNKAFTEITGYDEAEVLGKTPRILHSGRYDQAFYENMRASLTTRNRWQGEIWNRRKDGIVFPVWQTISAVRDESGNLTHYVSVSSDISAIKQSQERVRYLAYHDALTNLPNRLLFEERLTRAMQRAHRNGSAVALLFVDLDHFKVINDTLGHPIGDLALQEVARRLLSCVREEDTVARLGGDELALILEGISDVSDVAGVAEQVLATLSEPLCLQEHTAQIGASIGISIYPDNGNDTAGLLKCADTAMYQAKRQGRNNYRFFTPMVKRATSG